MSEKQAQNITLIEDNDGFKLVTRQKSYTPKKSPNKKNTLMCRHYRNNGFCNHQGCLYAHGLDQMVKYKPRRYRETECIEYSKYGTCKYGEKCSFKHKQRLLNFSDTLVKNPTSEDIIDNYAFFNNILINELYFRRNIHADDVLLKLLTY